MYTPRKIQGGFVGSLFLIATLVLFFFHTRPTGQQLGSLRATTLQMQKEIQVLTEKSGGAAEVSSVSEVEQKELKNQIPETIEQDIIVTELNRVSKAADVTFNALTFNLNQNADLPTVNIAAGFQGTSANIIRFLKMLESSTSRKFIVKNAGVSRTTTKEGIEMVNLNITFQAFYRKDI